MQNIRNGKLWINSLLILSLACAIRGVNLELKIEKNDNSKQIEFTDDNLYNESESNNMLVLDNQPLDLFSLVKSSGLEHKASFRKLEKILSKISYESENQYSGMALSNEKEEEYKRIALEYGFPYEIFLIIGDQESDGKWDNNGKISITNDYGEFQVNERNHPYIKENLDYTSDDLRYDPIKNAEAAAFLIRDIMNHPRVKNLNDIFGMYNGWTGWKNNEMARNYVKGCNERLQRYFPDFEYDHSKYINEEEVDYINDDYIINLICSKANRNKNELSNLLKFKKNIRMDSKYNDIILDFNIIGKGLAELIKEDAITEQEIWNQFYEYYLLDTSKLIMQNKYDEAMFRYGQMIDAIESYYGIKENYKDGKIYYEYTGSQKVINRN